MVVDDIWELYHVDEDPTESYDVSAQFPEKQGPVSGARCRRYLLSTSVCSGILSDVL